ncbi:MAG: tyrosine-type recombinase/integrase [Ekhidna sp.]|nr:tyrosine-type recombinase/integrase [Ekhidna sp.]
MKDFILHLEKNGYVEKSRQRAEYYAIDYVNWLTQRNLDIKEATYNDLLNYIGHLQVSGSSKHRINESLRNIRLYYDYLQIPNIAYGVKIRGEKHESLPLFSSEELDMIYQRFETKSKKGYWRHSDKIILGFIVYQCLDTRDIFRIELTDLDLNKGTVYIPEGIKRKASRTLKLESHQIIPLYDYIQNHKEKDTTEKLFSPQCTCLGRLQGQLKDLFKQVKAQAREMNLEVVRFNQIRQSRITLWIKQHGLRKTQYMGGFRRVDNVERYRQQDTEDLSQYVRKYHPLQ